MTKFFKNILYHLYLIGKTESDRIGLVERKKSIYKIADVSDRAIIASEAIFHNNQNNRSKIKVGEKTLIKGHLLVFKHGGEILIGDYCFIGESTKIWSAKKITIGNRVLISHNVNIHDNNSHPLNSTERHNDFVYILSNGELRDNNDLNERDIVIEDDVWIGFNCTILKGVTIGKGAIVGACTLVTTNIPPYSIVVGNPARVIRFVDQS